MKTWIRMQFLEHKLHKLNKTADKLKSQFDVEYNLCKADPNRPLGVLNSNNAATKLIIDEYRKYTDEYVKIADSYIESDEAKILIMQLLDNGVIS